ncbi:hypothetical protein [Thiorhodovibrio winogradskyi]|uniref:hypothetical protein n=1 Tax=Thiorhodovibrio winogradskyi TaxID=77007 RepID=UPI002E2DA91B|nr:hypothetical protein [Thiorhodovibrio winogradskyi]
MADLDLERMVISPDTFVTEALRKIYSDLIYGGQEAMEGLGVRIRGWNRLPALF